jgi:hypothetical protein
MKNQELFNRSISILVKAYLDGTLEKGSCCACAVGNLVSGNMGRKFDNELWADGFSPLWDSVFMTSAGEQTICPRMLDFPEVKAQIDATGYPWEDLAKIEYAFETAPGGMFGCRNPLRDPRNQRNHQTGNQSTLYHLNLPLSSTP